MTKIGQVEAIMLILTIIVTHTVLSMPTDILNNYKSASILNLIYVGIIAIIISYFIYKLFKKFPSMDIVDISEFIGGKILKNIIGIIFICYFIISSSLLLRNFCESIQILYFPMTDITFIIALFVIALGIVNNLSFSASIKSNVIILPIALISVVFLFFTNIGRFVPERIFPLLGEGAYNTFILGLTNLGSFGGIAYLYFLPPMLKNYSKFKKICIISILATSLYLIFTVATLLFIFTFFTNVSEISPLYTATRYIEFGSFFQRLESLFLLIWILIFACYISIVCKFSVSILKKLTNISDTKPLINIFCLLIFTIALIPKNLAVTQFFESSIYKYLVLIIVLLLGIGILIFANIIKYRQRLKVNVTEKRLNV